MKMRHSLLIAGLLATIAAVVPAIADLNYTEGDGVTRNKLLFDFICFTTKHCSAHVPVNSSGTEIATSSNPFRTDPTGTTTQPVSVSGGATSANQTTINTSIGTTNTNLGAPGATACATDTGSCALNALLQRIAQNLTTLNTTAGNPLAAGTAIIGKVGIDQTTPGTTNGVVNLAAAVGGSSTTGNIAANNTTAVVIKASAGTLYGAQVYGIGSAPAYLKIYNATSATCGSGTPVKRLMIPAASTAANGAGSNISFGTQGVAFGTGITYCITTGITDADTTAPAASTFLVNLDWQ